MVSWQLAWHSWQYQQTGSQIPTAAKEKKSWLTKQLTETLCTQQQIKTLMTEELDQVLKALAWSHSLQESDHKYFSSEFIKLNSHVYKNHTKFPHWFMHQAHNHPSKEPQADYTYYIPAHEYHQVQQPPKTVMTGNLMSRVDNIIQLCAKLWMVSQCNRWHLKGYGAGRNGWMD